MTLVTKYGYNVFSEKAMAAKDQNKTGTELQILKSIEQAYFSNNPNAQKRNTQKSLKWFSQYVPRSYNKARVPLMLKDQSMWQDNLTMGDMFLYNYDPLHKDKLPWYDTYPLIFPWDTWKTKSGHTVFLGINLHLLPPKLRYVAFRSLLSLRNEKRYRKSTKLKISWQVLSALANSKLFEHAVRMYRLDHVRSKFIKIPPESWELALFLPLARIKKGGKAEAWKV